MSSFTRPMTTPERILFAQITIPSLTTLIHTSNIPLAHSLAHTNLLAARQKQHMPMPTPMPIPNPDPAGTTDSFVDEYLSRLTSGQLYAELAERKASICKMVRKPGGAFLPLFWDVVCNQLEMCLAVERVIRERRGAVEVGGSGGRDDADMGGMQGWLAGLEFGEPEEMGWSTEDDDGYSTAYPASSSSYEYGYSHEHDSDSDSASSLSSSSRCIISLPFISPEFLNVGPLTPSASTSTSSLSIAASSNIFISDDTPIPVSPRSPLSPALAEIPAAYLAVGPFFPETPGWDSVAAGADAPIPVMEPERLPPLSPFPILTPPATPPPYSGSSITVVVYLPSEIF